MQRDLFFFSLFDQSEKCSKNFWVRFDNLSCELHFEGKKMSKDLRFGQEFLRLKAFLSGNFEGERFSIVNNKFENFN